MLLCCMTAHAQSPSPKKEIKSSKTNTNMPLNTEKLSNSIVKSAIEALEKGDSKGWFSLFTDQAELYDDGRKMDFKSFFSKAIGHERFTSIDKVENNGLDLYGKFHSDQWGDFKTYFKFYLNENHKITKLEIGQANY